VVPAGLGMADLWIRLRGRRSKQGGKSLANVITLLRVAVTPLFIAFMVMSNSNPAFKYAALAVFAFGAATDWADGVRPPIPWRTASL